MRECRCRSSVFSAGRAVACVLALGFAGLVAFGCESGDNKVMGIPTGKPDPDRLAEVQTEYEEETITLTVEASSTPASKEGVGHLRNGDWAKAVTAFENAVATDSDDVRSRFGLAVAYEMSGDLAKAEEQYKAVNLRENNADAQAGLERVRSKMED